MRRHNCCSQSRICGSPSRRSEVVLSRLCDGPIEVGKATDIALFDLLVAESRDHRIVASGLEERQQIGERLLDQAFLFASILGIGHLEERIGDEHGAEAQISGTVGGAIVAIANGLNRSIPAIAISTDEPCDEDDPPGGDLPACVAANANHYANVANFLADFIAHLETKPGFLSSESGLLPNGVALNVNYPPLPPESIQGVSINTQGRTLIIGGIPLDVDYRCFACAFIPVGASSPGGIGGAGFDPTPDVANSDSAAFAAGFITVVPIKADYTASKGLFQAFQSVIRTQP